MPGKTVSGAAVAMMAVGGVAIWSGLNNVPLLDAFRALAKGQAPTPNRNPAFQPLSVSSGSGSGSGSSTSGGGGNGNDIVNEAEKWVGKSKYVFGGCHGCKPCAPGDGVDCSSFVTWVMYRTGHYKGKCSMVAGSSMLAWGVKVPKNERQPGDVVLWPGHHCGIIKDKDTMIEASCTACGPVKYGNYSKRSGWVVLRAPDIAAPSGNAVGRGISAGLGGLAGGIGRGLAGIGG